MSFAIRHNNNVSLVAMSVLLAVTLGVIIRQLLVVVRKNDKEKHMPDAPSGILANIKGISGNQAPFLYLTWHVK